MIGIQLINLALEPRDRTPANHPMEIAATFEIVSGNTATRDQITVRYRVPHRSEHIVAMAHREFRAVIEAIHRQVSGWPTPETAADPGPAPPTR